jgi:hypothetical protein
VRNFCYRSMVALCFCFILMLPAAAVANDYYVAPSGSDSNKGSQSSPWQTIQWATDHFTLGSNGTTIHVAAGTYASADITKGGSSPTVRLVIQCDPGVASATAAIGQCMVNTWKPNPSSSILIQIEANNVDLVGFDIGNNAEAGNAIKATCADPPLGNSPIACPLGNSIHIIGNYVHDLGADVAGGTGIIGCPEGGAIGAGQHFHTSTDIQAVSNLILRYGKVSVDPGCHATEGIAMNVGANPGDNIYYNNIIGGMPTAGIIAENCNVIVSNNTVFSTADGIILADHDQQVCPGGNPGNNTVANNYVANVTNSIFKSGSTGYDCAGGVNQTLFSHNQSDGLGVDFQTSNGNTGLQGCDTVTPNPWVHRSPTAMFVNYQADGTGDYQLQASVGAGGGAFTCVAGGFTPCTPARDFDGVLRSPSISPGAYQAGTQASSQPPPSGLTALVE